MLLWCPLCMNSGKVMRTVSVEGWGVKASVEWVRVEMRE